MPSLKRAKPDREGPPIEETRKRNEEAENVKTNDQVMGLFEHLTKLTDENPESAEAASNALDVILVPARQHPKWTTQQHLPLTLVISSQCLHPIQLGKIFLKTSSTTQRSAFDDAPTPDLVVGSSTLT